MPVYLCSISFFCVFLISCLLSFSLFLSSTPFFSSFRLLHQVRNQIQPSVFGFQIGKEIQLCLAQYQTASNAVSIDFKGALYRSFFTELLGIKGKLLLWIRDYQGTYMALHKVNYCPLHCLIYLYNLFAQQWVRRPMQYHSLC